MKNKRTTGLVILILMMVVQICFGQNDIKSDAEIVKLADKSFEKGDYKEAGTLYAQLVSVNPNEALFNYRFGVCALKTDRKNVSRPLKYLIFAADNLIDKEDVYYYLGVAYHNNMKFAEAIEAFQNYVSVIVSPTPLSEDAEKRITYCENGLNLNKSNSVTESLKIQEMELKGFYKSYKLDQLGCNIILKPDQLKSGSSSSDQVELAFIPSEKDYIYFSEKDITGVRNLYRSAILPNGGFGTKEALNGAINTNQDEDYPVVLDQGKTLYFSSKGHSSMGGYDIFKSELDETTGQWGKAVNLDYEINSPFDDLLFVEDKNGQTAWYSTNRKSPTNKISVCYVKYNYGQQGNANATDNSATLNEPSAGTTQKIERQKKMNDRLRAGNLADSVYLIVGFMEQQIRSLTNLRDRANRLSKTKNEKTLLLSDELSASCRSLLNLTDEKRIMSELEVAKNKDIEFQTAQRQVDKASAISAVLGEQISIKRAELSIVKKDASSILSTSTTKSLQETEVLYHRFMENYKEADTLAIFSEELNLITQNEMKFDPQESEVFTNLNVFLQNQIKIENIKKTASSDQLQNFEAKNKESKVLMEMAINNRSKAIKEQSVLQQGYYIKDAQTFEETAINQQLEILKLSGQKVTSSYKSPPTKKEPPKSKVVVAKKETQPPVSKSGQPATVPAGVFYKVQLGAFGSEPSPEKLKGIDPVTTELIPGKSVLRYFGGQFTNKNQADVACVQYKKNGFSDAFVVAFNNGKRISLEEAKMQLDATNGQVQEKVIKPNPPKKQEQKVPVVNAQQQNKKTTVELKVQLAALRDQKPKTWIDDLSNKVGYIVDEIHLSSGVYVYASGSFTNYNDASAFLKSIKAKGFNDAFLIGVNAGDKIPVAKAIELLK